MQHPIELLKKYWKHDSFRPSQEEIIHSVLQDKDTFALLPTGGGKSLCFQIPTLMRPGVCLVISPLIALMEDQIQNLKKRGIKATGIIGTNSMKDIDAIFDNCAYGDYKFLYLAPERLKQEWILERVQKLTINLVAIDEAHCVSQWGHDFRPAYLEIVKLRAILPQTPFIALTASANHRTQQDIIKLLQLRSPSIFKQSFQRPNIHYGVYTVESKENTLLQIYKKHPHPTIVYTGSRKETEQLSHKLNALGLQSTFYHGGLNTQEKKKRLQLWLEEKTPIIIATNAFGMGIDKQNVRNVIHIHIPENLENYYQESGRAGRDGQKSFASILTTRQDIDKTKLLFQSTLFDKEFTKLIYKKLNSFLGIAYGEGHNMEFNFSFNLFCSTYSLPVKKTYHTLQFLDRQGILKLTQNFKNTPKIQFTADNNHFLHYVQNNEDEEHLLHFIVRNFSGIHNYKTEINLEDISKQTDISVGHIKNLLAKWELEKLCIYEPEDNDITIVFCETREDDRTLFRTFPYLKQQNDLKNYQHQAMLTYIQDVSTCKNRIILDYFDEKTNVNCGTCSSCITQKKKPETTVSLSLQEEILNLLRQRDYSVTELEAQTLQSKEAIFTALQFLLENQKIKPNSKNQYTLL